MPEKPSNFNEFDAAVVGHALGAEPRTMRDIAHGDGAALTVGETTLEVYRDAGFARVTTPDARIELYRVPRYTVSGPRVVFEQGEQEHRSRLQVRADGKVAFHPHLRAPESSTTGETAPSGRQDSPTPTDPSDNGTAASAARAAAPEGEKAGEVTQVMLQGRLGRDPWFKTDGEQPIGGFPLAVNDQHGKTTWHKIVVFDVAAEQLQEAVSKRSIGKGKLVDVTGHTFIRAEPKANGGVKKSPEFHASTVSRVTPTKARP